jgi:hypothetical protein
VVGVGVVVVVEVGVVVDVGVGVEVVVVVGVGVEVVVGVGVGVGVEVVVEVGVVVEGGVGVEVVLNGRKETMKITESWLQEKLACEEGVAWFLAQKETEAIPVLKALMKDDEFNWANWLIVRVMDRPQYLAYAIFAAESVIHTWVAKYPKDKRPQKAIKAAKAVLKNDTAENRAEAAWDVRAAWAAWAAGAAWAAEAAWTAWAAEASGAAWAAEAGGCVGCGGCGGCVGCVGCGGCVDCAKKDTD